MFWYCFLQESAPQETLIWSLLIWTTQGISEKLTWQELTFISGLACTQVTNMKHFSKLSVSYTQSLVLLINIVVRSQNGQILLGAASVRFRKFIGIFSVFKLTTKILYWNDDSIFIEHKVSSNYVQSLMNHNELFSSLLEKTASFMQRCYVSSV